MDAIELLLTRASQGKLREPAPDQAALQRVFAAALRAPDHGLLRPWRFQLIHGDARIRFGDLLRESLRRRKPDASNEDLERQAKKALRAPLLIVVSARVQTEHPKVPAIEQVISAGAAAQNILLALHAQGFGGMWRTGDAAYDPEVKRALGLAPNDAIVGFLYVGTPAQPAPELARPQPAAHVEEWRGPSSA
jgi:nitroreductase